MHKYKPTTPSRRRSSVLKHEKAGEWRPEKQLLRSLKSKAGRGSAGKITVRHQGGGHKRKYRLIDFSQTVLDLPGKVLGLQYDPNRGAKVALVSYPSGQKTYFLAVDKQAVGDVIEASRQRPLEIKPGNRMRLKHIPAGILISSIEPRPGLPAQAARGAGAGAVVLSQEDEMVILKMPSGEIRKFSNQCLATIGQVSNPEYNLVRLGKAGRMRHRGVRPRVQGKAMNPVDHPHGGGEGHSPVGMRGGPKTPWGKPAMGVKTRNPNKASDILIIRRRNK